MVKLDFCSRKYVSRFWISRLFGCNSQRCARHTSIYVYTYKYVWAILSAGLIARSRRLGFWIRPALIIFEAIGSTAPRHDPSTFRASFFERWRTFIFFFFSFFYHDRWAQKIIVQGTIWVVSLTWRGTCSLLSWVESWDILEVRINERYSWIESVTIKIYGSIDLLRFTQQSLTSNKGFRK
jgi:hypothetical protein